MSNQRIINAWKNPQYRSQLSATEAMMLPTHPAGSFNLPAGGPSDESDDFPECSPYCVTYQPCADSTITPVTY